MNLKDLLDSANSRSNPLVHPGDIVKVTRAGVVCVIGEVRKPGGFALKSNESISVVQALALSEGLTQLPPRRAMPELFARTHKVVSEKKLRLI